MIVDQSSDVMTMRSSIPGVVDGVRQDQAITGCNLDFSACAHYGRMISFLDLL